MGQEAWISGMTSFVSTAIYDNRLEDKQQLEAKLSLNEQGDDSHEFHLPDGTLFARGYERIVYGDHGPYLEFGPRHILCKLVSKFGNKISPNNLPGLDYKYYYYWLYPQGFEEVKVYFQIKPVTNLPDAPKRDDGKPSQFNRAEGYADYKRGFVYVNPYSFWA
jgi:hypothetical protein